jgi:hypothetical protein
MSITVNAFEEAGYWLENPSVDIPAGNLYPTNFGNLVDGTTVGPGIFQCAVESISNGDGDGDSYPGPGLALEDYYNAH